jgi:nucleotide-binding universal stress UspA family protein
MSGCGCACPSPLARFGDNALLVEATRPLDQARRLPLSVGERVRVGVRRIHTLVHPGMNFLIVTDGSQSAQAALDLGGQIAQLSHARVTILGYGLQAQALERHLQETKEQLGSGLAALDIRASPDLPDVAIAREAERQPYDLVILGAGGFLPPGGVELSERVLQSGGHHLLLVPGPRPTLLRGLICVTDSEPAKEDVLFAGRLLRFLGGEATLLSVIPAASRDPALPGRIERFLKEGVRTLDLLGVAAKPLVRSGSVRDIIRAQLSEHDFIVLGAPLNARDGRVTLAGVVAQILNDPLDRPILIVRSHYAVTKLPPLTADGRINIVEEIIP